MTQPRVLILRAPGTNCDAETAFAFQVAGAKTEVLHINRVLESPNLLLEVSDPLCSRRFQLWRRCRGRPHLGQPDRAPFGRSDPRFQGQRQADLGDLQWLSGADQDGSAAGARSGTWPRGNADFERIRQIRGSLGASEGDQPEDRCFSVESIPCTCPWPMPKGSSLPATRQ